LLEAILRRAPRHTPTLEKLLDFVLGAGDDRRTAELAAQLQQIPVKQATSAVLNDSGIAPPLPTCCWFDGRGIGECRSCGTTASTEAAEPGSADVSIPEITAEPAP